MPKRNPYNIPEEFRGLVDQLFAINADYSKRFLSQALDLDRYKREHPTSIMVFKCMDGRLLFSSFCETWLGYLRNFRNYGGQFNFGWRSLRDFFVNFAEKAHYENRGCLAIITYHYSKGDKKRGCAAYKYDIKASIRGARGFKGNIERAYKGLPHEVMPIIVGIETDEESLIFHNDKLKPIKIAKLPREFSEKQMYELLIALYPDMPIQMRLDLLPLLVGNHRHVQKIRDANRPIMEMQHNEWIFGVGGASAFDFLHVPNTAILVGQYNPNLGKVIKEALKVIRDHWTPGKKFLTLAAASYGRGIYEQHAMEDPRYYDRLVREVVNKHYPELKPDMHQLRGLVDLNTQKLKLI